MPYAVGDITYADGGAAGLSEVVTDRERRVRGWGATTRYQSSRTNRHKPQ